MDSGTVKKIKLLTEIEDKIKLGLLDTAQPWLFYQAQAGIDTLNEVINKAVIKPSTPVIVTPTPRGGPTPPPRGDAPMTRGAPRGVAVPMTRGAPRGTPPRGPRGPVSGGAAKTSVAELTTPDIDKLKLILVDIAELKKTLADTSQIAKSKNLIKKIKTDLDSALPTKNKVISPMFTVQTTVFSSRLGIEQAFEELSTKTDALLANNEFEEVAKEFQLFLDASKKPSVSEKNKEKFPNFRYQRELIIKTLTDMRDQNSFLRNYINDPVFRKKMDIEHGSPVIGDKTFIEVLTGNGKIKGLDQLIQDRQAIVKDKNEDLEKLALKHQDETKKLEEQQEKELEKERSLLTDKDLEEKEAEIKANYAKLSLSLVETQTEEREKLTNKHDELIKKDPRHTTFKIELQSLKDDLISKITAEAVRKPALLNLSFSLNADEAMSSKVIETDALGFIEDAKELISNAPFLNFMENSVKKHIKDEDHADIKILEKLFSDQLDAYHPDTGKIDDSFKKTLEETLKLLDPMHRKLLETDLNTALASRAKTLDKKHPDKLAVEKLFEKQLKAYRAGNIKDFLKTTVEKYLTSFAPENRILLEDDLRNALEFRTEALKGKVDFEQEIKKQIRNIKQAKDEIISNKNINISSIFSHKEGFDEAKQALNKMTSDLTIIKLKIGGDKNTGKKKVSAADSLLSVKTLQQAIIFPKKKEKDDFFELSGKTPQSRKARTNFMLLLREGSQMPTQDVMLTKLTELVAEKKGPTIPLPNIVIVGLASGYISLKPNEKFGMLQRDISDKTCKINEGKLKDFEHMVSDLYLQLGKPLPKPMSTISSELKTLLAMKNCKDEVDLLEIKPEKIVISPAKYQEKLAAEAAAKLQKEKEAAEKLKAKTTVTPTKSLSAGGTTPSKAKIAIKITYTPEQQKEIDSLQEAINRDKSELALVESKISEMTTLQHYDKLKFDQQFGQHALLLLEKKKSSLTNSIEKADAKSKEIAIEAKKLCTLNATTSALEELKKKLEAGQTVTKEEELDVIAKTQESFTALQDSEKLQREKAEAEKAKNERIEKIQALAKETREKINQGANMNLAIAEMSQKVHHEDWEDVSKEFIAQISLPEKSGGFKLGNIVIAKRNITTATPDPTTSSKRPRL